MVLLFDLDYARRGVGLYTKPTVQRNRPDTRRQAGVTGSAGVADGAGGARGCRGKHLARLPPWFWETYVTLTGAKLRALRTLRTVRGIDKAGPFRYRGVFGAWCTTSGGGTSRWAGRRPTPR